MDSSKTMSFDAPAGDVRVVPEGGGTAYWQPKPANGYAEVILASNRIESVQKFSMGRQLVPPGCRVRLHAHDRAEEVFYVLSGSGVAEIDGQPHRLAPGTSLYFGHNRQHTIINDGTEDLQWLWFFMPGRLEDFFAAIGRERKPGEAAPAPFERPADVREIEKRTVFA
jgi:mannose-6-phosphate isomerase-like protein (cupin superfamily)